MRLSGQNLDQEDTRVCLTEGWNREIFVLTENGNVWLWSHGVNALTGLVILPLGTCFGTALFLLFAIIFLFFKSGLTRQLKKEL